MNHDPRKDQFVAELLEQHTGMAEYRDSPNVLLHRMFDDRRINGSMRLTIWGLRYLDKHKVNYWLCEQNGEVFFNGRPTARAVLLLGRLPCAWWVEDWFAQSVKIRVYDPTVASYLNLCNDLATAIGLITGDHSIPYQRS